jgi:hypothetical protein
MVFESITDPNEIQPFGAAAGASLETTGSLCDGLVFRLTAAQCSDLNGRLSGVSKVAQAGD